MERRKTKKLEYVPIITHIHKTKQNINLITPVSYLNKLRTLHYWKTSDNEKPEVAENNQNSAFKRISNHMKDTNKLMN